MGSLITGLVILESGIAWLYMKETNEYFCIDSAGLVGHRGLLVPTD